MKKFSEWLFVRLHQEELHKVQGYLNNEKAALVMADTPSEANAQRAKLIAVLHVIRTLCIPVKDK